MTDTFGLTFVEDLFEYPFVKNHEQILPYEFAKTNRILPLEEVEGILLVAISDPLALEALEEVRLMTEKRSKRFWQKKKLSKGLLNCATTKAKRRDLSFLIHSARMLAQ